MSPAQFSHSWLKGSHSAMPCTKAVFHFWSFWSLHHKPPSTLLYFMRWRGTVIEDSAQTQSSVYLYGGIKFLVIFLAEFGVLSNKHWADIFLNYYNPKISGLRVSCHVTGHYFIDGLESVWTLHLGKLAVINEALNNKSSFLHSSTRKGSYSTNHEQWPIRKHGLFHRICQ